MLGVMGGGGAADRGGSVFAFGKHRGKSFTEVMESDAGYCEWALRQDNPNGGMKDFVDFLRERRFAGKGGGGGFAGGRPPAGARPPAAPGQQRPPWNAAMPPWQVAGSSGLMQDARPAGAGGGGGAPAPQSDADRRFLRTHQLSSEFTLVCEMVQDHHFMVRAERVAVSNNPNAGSASTYVPPHVWSAVGSLPGATLAGDRRSWLFPVSSYEHVARGLEDMGTVERIPAWVFQTIERANREQKAELDGERLPSRLLPYQLEGVKFGAGRGGRCLIGDEMGLGKTLQALALAAQYTEEWPVLVVCPSSLRWVWKEQAEQWLPGLVHGDEVQVIKKGSDNLNPKAAFWIISYNLLATDAKKGKFQQRPDGTPHLMVIADESHNIKEWSAARTKAVVPLLRNAKRSVCLSGTPTRNSPDELHPQLCGLLPGLTVRYADFRSRYCVIQQSTLFNGRVVSKVAGARNAAELNHLLTSTVMVRRLKKEVLSQLPPKRRQRIPIEVSDARVLKEIRSEMRQLNDVLGGASAGSEAVSTLFMKTAKAKLPAVKEYITDVLERGDEKAIIFAHHRLMLDEISALLDQQLPRDTCHIRIDGQTQASKRPDLVRKFQEDPNCRIALLSITACGEGLTLTAAGLVIFAELYWVPGAVEQAEARAHRIGTQHNKVVVEFLVVPNSPDEYIYNSMTALGHWIQQSTESLTRATHPLMSQMRSAFPAGGSDAGADAEAVPPGRQRRVSQAESASLAAALRSRGGAPTKKAATPPAGSPLPSARHRRATAPAPAPAAAPPVAYEDPLGLAAAQQGWPQHLAVPPLPLDRGAGGRRHQEQDLAQDGSGPSTSPQAKQPPGLVAQLDEFFRRGTPRAAAAAPAAGCPRMPAATRLEQRLANWARARGLPPGAAPRLVSAEAPAQGRGVEAGERPLAATAREASILWRGVGVDILLEGGFAANSPQMESGESPRVASAHTDCGWADARLGVAVAAERAAGLPLEAFLDALWQAWQQAAHRPDASIESAGISMAKAAAGERHRRATVGAGTEGRVVQAGGGGLRPRSASPASDSGSSSFGSSSSTRSCTEVGPRPPLDCPAAQDDGFVQWLSDRPPLWRFDQASRGLAWDFPPSKAEKRELLLLQLFAEEGERQAQIASLRAALPLAMGGSKGV